MAMTKMKPSYLPLWNLASGGNFGSSYLPRWDSPAAVKIEASYLPWWDIVSGGNIFVVVMAATKNKTSYLPRWASPKMVTGVSPAGTSHQVQ